MEKDLKKKFSQEIFQCPECGFFYREKKWAEKCRNWCRKYKTCNLEIIKHAIKEGHDFFAIKEGFLLAFGELFLKSEGVRKNLKEKLVKNLSFFFKKEKLDFKIYSFRERIFVETGNSNKCRDILRRTFGIVWFGKAFFLENARLNDLSSFIKENYHQWIKKGETFALEVRKDPAIGLKREDIIAKIAVNIERKVNLTKPQRKIFIEGRKKGWFVYFKKEKGPGGLPVGSQGKVLALISGGIDSPVASYLMMKRGAESLWLHFHSFPLVSDKSIEKTRNLAEILLKYQPRLKIYFVPFSEIQMEIKRNVPSKYRIILYRRLMFRIAEKIALKENCKALITGESLGQVSSQTLSNVQAIEETVKIPVFRPLIGMDKEEIISLAKKIKTFEISIQPQEDCCSLFVPKHPTAAGRLDLAKKFEKNLKITKLISKALKETKIETF